MLGSKTLSLCSNVMIGKFSDTTFTPAFLLVIIYFKYSAIDCTASKLKPMNGWINGWVNRQMVG